MITADRIVKKNNQSYKDTSNNEQIQCHNAKNWPKITQVFEKISDADLKSEVNNKVGDHGENRNNIVKDIKDECEIKLKKSSKQGVQVNKDLYFEEEAVRELTLGYVRVRELQRDVERAKKVLAKMANSTICNEKKSNVDNLKEKISFLFNERARTALVQAKWRKVKHEQKVNGSVKLIRLKSRADLVERKHYQLRKQLLGLQNVELPKKSRSFLGNLFTNCCRIN